MRFLVAITLLILCSISLALESPISKCSQFNKVALQFALVQNNMQPPLDFLQLQNLLGQKTPESNSVITTYTWTCKNRVLLVRASNEKLTEKALTGNDDGSPASRKINQAYEKLKAATSIWSIKEIRGLLDSDPACSANSTSKQLQNYTWSCGIGSLKITTDQDNNIITATISYRTNKNKETIEAELGDASHPAWNIAVDTFGEFHRAWQRSFNP